MTINRVQLGVVAAALSSDLREAVKLARASDFKGVQLDVRLGELDLTALSSSGRRDVRAILRDSEQNLLGLQIDLDPRGLGPGADIDAAIDRVEKVLQAAQGLQAPLVCVELGPLPAPTSHEKPAPRITPDQAGMLIIPSMRPQAATAQETVALDTAFAASVDSALVELGQRADRYGIGIAMRSDLASFASLERALNAAACPWFGIDLDPVAMLRDHWPRDEFFSRLGAQVRHVRGRDAILGADRRTKPAVLRQGSVQWEQLLDLLDECAYPGWITIDPAGLNDRRAAATTGAARLRSLLKPGRYSVE